MALYDFAFFETVAKRHPEAMNWVKAIEKDPGVRMVYADWLEEHGEDDEANRQRKYEDALKILVKYADEDWIYRLENKEYRRQHYLDNDMTYSLEHMDDPSDDVDAYHPPDMKGVMAQISYWADYVKRDGNIHFSDTFPQEDLRDPARRKVFWEAFEVVAGISPPEELRNEGYYSCSC